MENFLPFCKSIMMAYSFFLVCRYPLLQRNLLVVLIAGSSISGFAIEGKAQQWTWRSERVFELDLYEGEGRISTANHMAGWT